jgi:hypothetical protein
MPATVPRMGQGCSQLDSLSTRARAPGDCISYDIATYELLPERHAIGYRPAVSES